MKKVFYVLLSAFLIIATYFYYEHYLFTKYIDNPIQKNNMNVPINENAPVKAKNQIEVDAPVDAVWEVLTGINNWTNWQKDVTETVVHGEIQQGTLFDWKAGGLSFKSKIHTCNPKSMFGWTGKTLGASAIHNWIFETKGDTTIVRVEESLQGVFPNLFKSYFQKNLETGIAKNLSELKSTAERK
jgi:uncharacterized membrane protein